MTDNIKTRNFDDGEQQPQRELISALEGMCTAYERVLNHLSEGSDVAFTPSSEYKKAKSILIVASSHPHPPAPEQFEKLPHPWIHHKKCWTPYFNEMKSGRKKFDKRVWDTDYQEGDTLIQEEWNPDTGYTGDSIGYVITYILRGEFAEPGMCLMSVDGVEFEPREKREQSIRDCAARTATFATLEALDRDFRGRLVEDVVSEIRRFPESLRCDPEELSGNTRQLNSSEIPNSSRPIGLCNEGTAVSIGDGETYIECRSQFPCNYQASSDGPHPLCTMEAAVLEMAKKQEPCP